MAPLGIASIPHTCLLSEACSSPNTGRSPQNSDGHKKAAESFAQPQSPQPHEQCCPLPVLAPSTPQNAQTLISHLQITWTTLPRAKLDKCWPARPAICQGGIGLHLAPVGQRPSSLRYGHAPRFLLVASNTQAEALASECEVLQCKAILCEELLFFVAYKLTPQPSPSPLD